MKAYEVKIMAMGKSKDYSTICFVAAQNINEVRRCYFVDKIWYRPDIKAEECPCEIIDNTITTK